MASLFGFGFSVTSFGYSLSPLGKASYLPLPWTYKAAPIPPLLLSLFLLRSSLLDLVLFSRHWLPLQAPGDTVGVSGMRTPLMFDAVSSLESSSEQSSISGTGDSISRVPLLCSSLRLSLFPLGLFVHVLLWFYSFTAVCSNHLFNQLVFAFLSLPLYFW